MHFTLTRGMILDLPPDFIPRRRLFQFSMYPKTGISLFNIWLAGPVAVPEAAEYSAQDVAKPHPELRFTVMLSVLSIGVFWRRAARDLGFSQTRAFGKPTAGTTVQVGFLFLGDFAFKRKQGKHAGCSH